MSGLSRIFYLFLGFHNFLLGLFPFFLPVYLYKSGYSFVQISQFIALTGCGFIITLFLFDRLRSKSLVLPITLSFIFEIVLLLLLLQGSSTLLFISALVNGGYTCMYWTLQRILFLQGGTEKDTGRRFGDFQIYVLIVLKIGIFTGGVLLEHSGIVGVTSVSILCGVLGVATLIKANTVLRFPDNFSVTAPVHVKGVVHFSDDSHSRTVFFIDGVYLYLESYFWVISLFLIVGESFVKLGGLVVVIGVLLAILFYLIKNKIDSFEPQRVYCFAVTIYILSWLLRGGFTLVTEPVVQMCLLLLIGFTTSFFRLAFNKRFFDHAHHRGSYEYLFYKSYLSQAGLVVFFFCFAFLVRQSSDIQWLLTVTYLSSAIVAGGYLFYRPYQKT